MHRRGQWVRTNGDLLTNRPAGFPSGQRPISQPPGPHMFELDSPQWWVGSDSASSLLTPAQQLAAVTRATALIVSPLAQVPWKVRPRSERGTYESNADDVFTPRWLSDPMLLRPDARFLSSLMPAPVRLNRAAFWAQWIRRALWQGYCGLLFIEADDGEPIAGSMRLVDRTQLAPTRVGGYGALRWQLGNGTETLYSDEDGRFDVGRPWRVVVLRNPLSDVTDDGDSFGVFEQHPDTFGLAEQMSTYARGTFRSGVPAGYLQVTERGLTQEQSDLLRSKWLAAHGGDRRSIAVLNATTSFHALNLSPVDTALPQMKQATLVEIAHSFGLDAPLLNAPSGDSSTYKNQQELYSFYRLSTLAMWERQAEETLSCLLSGEQSVEIDLTQALIADTRYRYASYTAGIQSGWLTKNEARAYEGLPPLPELEPQPVPPQLAQTQTAEATPTAPQVTGSVTESGDENDDRRDA